MGVKEIARSGQTLGCMGLLGILLFIGLRTGGPDDSNPPSAPPPPIAPAALPPIAPPYVPEPRDAVYIHGTLNVHAAADSSAAILRTLRRSDYVLMGPMDANGWARVYSDRTPDGYVYRRSGLVQLTPPVDTPPVSTYSRPGAPHRDLIRGPRGGCYYINSNGNKTYVDRDRCN